MSSELSPRTIAGLLRALGESIAAEVNALPAEVCRWRAAPGEWSINETLGHLIEAERRGFDGRIQILLAEEQPQLQTWDQEAVARERADQDQAPAVVLAEFLALRGESVRHVEAIRPDQLARSGLHPDVGEITVRDLLHEWIHHDRSHCKQILSIVQAYAWEHMGNCRRFSEID